MTQEMGGASAKTPPARPKVVVRVGDRVFSGSARGAGIFILAMLAAVSGFLLLEGFPAIVADPEDISLLSGQSFWLWVGPLVFGTFWASALGLLVAFPLAIGIALFISHYAPRRIATTLGYLVDLLAAVPSVVYGLWGAVILAPALQPLYVWLEDNLGFIKEIVKSHSKVLSIVLSLFGDST